VTKNYSFDDILNTISTELRADIDIIKEKIREYGSFTVIANSIISNQFKPRLKGREVNETPAIPEYITLLCLQWRFSLGDAEFTNPRAIGSDMRLLNEIAEKIYDKFLFVHFSKLQRVNSQGAMQDIPRMAQFISSFELTVRNPTFESFHWDVVEELYQRFNDLIEEAIGVPVTDAINICLAIRDLMKERLEQSLKRCRDGVEIKYKELLAFKNRGKMPSNFYPQEILDQVKRMPDIAIRQEIEDLSITYELVMLGHTMSFESKDIAMSENI
jgi:hypothetical protein